MGILLSELRERGKEYQRVYREWKYTGKIEGIITQQKPNKVVIGSPREVNFLKDRNGLPGGSYAVSWYDEFDGGAAASIYYAVSKLNLKTFHLIGSEDVRERIFDYLRVHRLIASDSIVVETNISPVKEQPRGIVLSCSDSRVLDSAIFGDDRTLILNIAGNVPSLGVINTIKHYLSQGKVDFIAVLGHSNCGAVDTAYASNMDIELKPILSIIRKSLRIDPSQLVPGARATESEYLQNARSSLIWIIKSVGGEALKNTSLFVAYHDLATGSVDYTFTVER